MADRDKHLQKDLPPPPMPLIAVTLPTPAPTPQEEDKGAKDQTIAAVEKGYAAAYAPATLSKNQTRIDKFEDKLTDHFTQGVEAYEKLNAFFTANSATINSAASVLLNVDVKSVENAITRFTETSAVVMKGLDCLAEVHPFVSVAVSAFKLVLSFDLTRRANNKKVLVVKLQMQDMMSVLFQLRNMRDPADVGPDGTPLQDRMAGMLQNIADDITACGSACDVYMKKSFLAKTIKAKIYETRLAGYSAQFDGHKKKIVFALQMHTALGVDTANQKLDTQSSHLLSIELKMEMLFKKLDTPREKDMRSFIAENGGPKAVVENEATLTELVAKSGETLAGTTGGGTEVDMSKAKKILTKELAEDIDEAFRKNIKLFESKLQMQSEQLQDAIAFTGEHIIHALSDGAHKRILDNALSELWKDQGWKGSVKARHFVLALNDYYTEKFSAKDIASLANSVAGSAPPSPIISPVDGTLLMPAPETDDDRWALSYINVAHLQPILEAVDDNGTGFVSIKEVNDFAMTRPKGWSLLRWVAFWAAGWHISVTWYKNRIYNLLNAMMNLIPHMTAGNIQAANTYFAGAGIRRTELLLRSTKSAAARDAYGKDEQEDAKLRETKDEIQRLEEKRLERRLEGLFYELDEVATVRLITGPRRIERYVFPLLYLLLKRHFDIMRLACVHILDDSEWDTMASSLTNIFKVVDERTRRLEAIFKSNSLDVSDRLGGIAFGMFQLAYGSCKREPVNNTIDSFEEEDGYEDAEEDLGPDSDDDEETTKDTFARINRGILRYEIQDEPKKVYDFEHEYPVPAAPTDAVEGLWVGQLIESYGSPWEGTMSLMLSRSGGKVTGGVESFLGIWELEGTVQDGAGGGRKLTFTLTWPDGYVAECEGEYDPATEILKGTWIEKEVESDEEEDDDDDDDNSSYSPSESESESSSEESEDDDEEEDKDGDKEGNDEATEEDGEDDSESSSSSESSSDVDTGTFIFRRTPAFAFRHRYTDEEFAKNPAKARWKFAIEATMAEVQRQRRTWSYLDKWTAERRRFFELMLPTEADNNDMTPWTPLTDDEDDELIELRARLRSCDARFYYEMVQFELQKRVAFDRRCDSCKRDIHESCLTCIDCMDDIFDKGVNLCPLHAEETPTTRDFVHQRSHLMIKAYRRLHEGDVAWLVPEARVVAERVKKVCREAHSLLARVEGASKSANHVSKKKAKKAEQLCCGCGNASQPPYFACVECVDDTFVCTDCDANRAEPSEEGEHSLNHALVYIHNSDAEEEQSTDDAKMAELQTKMANLNNKLGALEEKLDSRFTSLEALLTGLSQKLLENV
ncbi:Protein kinase domain-containing protein [Mycena kentingensis (nom. inval.)]|nr:Protein kinase domain-containing protein [Mycena kentingensis (nom. inval.)]